MCCCSSTGVWCGEQHVTLFTSVFPRYLQVALRVQSRTWKAYQLTAVEERPAAQVARDLQMRISEVYVAKSRVMKMLRETIIRLEDC